MNSTQLEVSPREASDALAGGATMVDVREAQEFSISRLPGSHLISMGSVPQHLATLETWSDHGPILVLCHHGVRSLQVVAWLRAQGVENCWSVAGGIDQWSCQVDPGIPRY